MTLFDVVAKRRLDDGERMRHDAFLHEIATSWRPANARDRLLHRRARVVHLAIRLFGGGPTLLQIAVASALIALATALRVVAPAPHTASYVVPSPEWARGVVVAGMLTLAFEAFRSPRHIRNRRWIALAIAPIPVVQLWALVASPFPNWPNWPLRLGWTLGGAGIALLICAARLRNHLVLRLSLIAAVAGAATVAVSELVGTFNLAHDHDPVLAAASALMLFGCSLIAVGLLRSRVELAA